MPEYRALRDRYSILDLIKNSELAAEVTLQPVSVFELDAAIIFADLLPPLEGMGLHVEFVKGNGPVIRNPIRSAADIDALSTPPAGEALDFTLSAIKIVKRELAGKMPLIGFAGAPFTLASYAIEGGGTHTFHRVKQLMYNYPDCWHNLMMKLSKISADYLIAQIVAGVSVVQIFDSWVGMVSPYDYRSRILPYTAGIVSTIRELPQDIPIIYFGTGTSGILPVLKELQVDVIGIDWRIDLIDGWSILGDNMAAQGNLDPMVLCSSETETREQAKHILDRVNGKRGHIFNLGHGILKETPVDHVKMLIDFVHEYGARK